MPLKTLLSKHLILTGQVGLPALQNKTEPKMGQQHRKETKRRRRSAYIKRQKENAKNSAAAAPVQLATKVVKADAEPTKKAPAKKKAAAEA